MCQDEFQSHSVRHALAQATGRAPILLEKQSSICQQLLIDVERALAEGEQLSGDLRRVEADIQQLVDVAFRKGVSLVALLVPLGALVRNWALVVSAIRVLASKGDSNRTVAISAALAAMEGVQLEIDSYRHTFREARQVAGRLRELRRRMQHLGARVEGLHSELRRNNCRLGGRPSRNIFGQGRVKRRRKKGKFE